MVFIYNSETMKAKLYSKSKLKPSENYVLHMILTVEDYSLAKSDELTKITVMHKLDEGNKSGCLFKGVDPVEVLKNKEVR